MSRQGKIRVFIVDDHPLFRSGLRQVIVSDERFEMAGEADNGQAALQNILESKPDVAVLDVNLPGQSGLEVAAALQRKKARVNVVMLTMAKDEQVFNQAMNMGVKGYVLKENASSEILSCIVTVAGGEPYVSPSLTSYLLRRRNLADRLATRKPTLEDLTMAEKRILKAIAQKKTSKDIAAEFFISPRTVESHRANICNKLDIKGPNGLLQFAVEHRDALNQLA